MPFDRGIQSLVFDNAEIDLDSTAADKYTWIPSRTYLVLAAGFIYTEATDAAIATPGVVSIDHTPAGGSRVEKASYTAEVSKAIGTEAKALDTNSKPPQFTVRSGDSVFFELKTAQTATEAGKVKPILYVESVPEGEL